MSKQRVVEESSSSEDDRPIAARKRNLSALTAAVKKEVKKGKAQARADKSSTSATVKNEKSETAKPDAKAKSKAEDEKPLQIKGKPKGKDGKAKGGEIVVKRERKVFDLPGQRYETPLERDPLRIFYETLREQRPSSEMAEIWLMDRGLLPKEEAAKAFATKQKSAGGSRSSFGRKATPVKRIKPETVDDDDDEAPLAKKRKPLPVTTKTESDKKKPGAGNSKTKTSIKKKRKGSSSDAERETEEDDSESEDEKPLASRRAKKAK
eukprot:jgi/Chlat1/737/Chrsp104S01218